MMKFILLALLLLLACLLGSFSAGGPGNADLWYHLASGRLIAQGQFPFGFDPFSGIEPTPRWIHHAWLTDLLSYLTYSTFGGSILVAIKSGLVALLAFVLVKTCRPTPYSVFPVASALLALLAIIPRLGLHPSIVSYFLFAVLNWALIQPRRPKPWMLPAFAASLFFFWANLDGGFWLGLLLLAFRAGGEWLQPSAGNLKTPAASNAVSAREYSVALVCALAACVISPFHIHNLLSLPTEFAALGVPAALRNDPLISPFFRSPFAASSVRDFGIVPTFAYGILVVGTVISFFANSADWSMPRAITWFVFVVLSSYFVRLVPYSAIVAAPILASNFASAADRWLESADDRSRKQRRRTLSLAGIFGTATLLLALTGLCFLAWPGWLASSPNSFPGERRVSWTVEPDPTQVRLAKQFAQWDQDKAIGPQDGQCLNLNPEFAYYLAWFSPAQKSFCDTRLTSPVESLVDYLKARRAIIESSSKPEPAPTETDQLLKKNGVRFLTASGDFLLNSGLSRSLLRQPERWPLLSIQGQGTVFGHGLKPGTTQSAKLLSDPVQLACSGSNRIPSSSHDKPKPPAKFWDRYLQDRPPTPPDTHESALWLQAFEVSSEISQASTAIWQIVSAIGQYAPSGIPSRASQYLDPISFVQAVPPQPYRDAWSRITSENLANRARALLAVRAARKAIAESPDDYQGFYRALRAYRVLDTDSGFALAQQLVSARKALTLMPLAESDGLFVAPDARAIYADLLDLYRQINIVPNTQSPPLDFMLDALVKMADASRQVLAQTPPQNEEAVKRAQAFLERANKDAETLREVVKKRIEELETKAATAKPLQRIQLAASMGLAKTALQTLKRTELQELDASAVRLYIDLLLLAGDGESAWELANAPILKSLNDSIDLRAKTAAAVGDYDSGIAALLKGVDNDTGLMGTPLAHTLQTLFFPDALNFPLSRVITCPSWGGLWDKKNIVWPGDILETAGGIQQRFDWLAQEGLIKLEQGDVPGAQKAFDDSLNPKGVGMPFSRENLASRWLDLIRLAEKSPSAAKGGKN